MSSQKSLAVILRNRQTCQLHAEVLYDFLVQASHATVSVFQVQDLSDTL